MQVGELIERDGRACVWCGRELRREGVEVDVDALRSALSRLARSPRRRHREAALDMLRRLEAV